MSEFTVVVVGGGITGLTAALHLMQASQRGHSNLRCKLYEASPRLGGKIATHRENGFVMEGGPDSMLARKTAGIQLIRELGVESEVVGTNPASAHTTVLTGGKLEPIPPGTNLGMPVALAPFATTHILTNAGKARALLDVVLPRSHTTGDETIGSLLRRRFGDELVDRLIEPLLAGIYAGRVDGLSVQATFPQFQDMEKTYRSLIIGSRKARKAARQASTGKSGAASGAGGGHPSNSPRSAFITLRDGLETLIERLYDTLSDWAEMYTSTAVVNIEPGDGQSYRVTIARGGVEETVHADAVIVTTPAFAAAKLLAPLIPAARLLEEIPYVSTATVMLGFPRSAVPESIQGSGFVIPPREKRAITAATYVSNKWPHTTPEDAFMIRCYVGRAGDEARLSLSDTAMADVVRRDLQDITGLQATPVFHRVVRWDHAMPQYRINHLARLVEVENQLKSHAPGVYIAGAGYRGLGIPDCIVQGRDAAENVIKRLKLYR